MTDLVMELVTATNPDDREVAYRNLEKAGIDRRAADEMAAEFTGKERDRNGRREGV